MLEKSSRPVGCEQEVALAAGLITAYGLRPAEISRIAAGTATDNYRVIDEGGDQWFAKVYRDPSTLERDRAAVELAEFARAGGVPVPLVRRTRGGEVVESWRWTPPASGSPGWIASPPSWPTCPS